MSIIVSYASSHVGEFFLLFKDHLYSENMARSSGCSEATIIGITKDGRLDEV